MTPEYRVDPSFRAKLVLAGEDWLQALRDGWWRSLGTTPPALGPGAKDAAAVVGPLVAGRSVALIGNATSLLDDPPPRIDDHDVIVRINRGAHVAEQLGTIGSRTDILLLAGRRMAITLAVDEHLLKHKPGHTLFMSVADRRRLPRWLARRMSYYPAAWREALEAELGARPSTGAMGIDLFSRLVGDGTLHLYGFDFWDSPTSYNLRTKVGPHAPNAERDFALRRVRPEHIHGWRAPDGAGPPEPHATREP
ncbi:hypothetical protein [Acuticoccus sediminis]|uniref:hypothetical protein n=1 Tax=Acuticoccus sediminis TaxID=2184697 RepID=UPI001CFE3BBE|nr:hypothetical protein [Acuticoccus sediminis]